MRDIKDMPQAYYEVNSVIEGFLAQRAHITFWADFYFL